MSEPSDAPASSTPRTVPMESPAHAPVGRGEQRIPRPSTWRMADDEPWVARHPPSAAETAEAVHAARLDLIASAPTFSDARPSAVLIALVDGPRGVEVLLTKRSKALRNHSGEISFPGGRIDPGETPVETALREAREEVGLDPQLVTVRGQLSNLSTVVSRSYIVPIVGVLTEHPTLAPHEPEVARILWVPLAELVRPQTFREEWWGTPPLHRRMTFFELDDETVWGATAHMLRELLSLLYSPPAALTAP
ncbi:MAG: putative hydrolase, partial [Acidimicrobiales bacterium]|nr:putative hydrolase [Acidimicrobiales bacterium]